MNKVELLAPAGNYENAFFAISYGADAIYQGLSGFSLRQTKKAEINLSEIITTIKLAHTHGRKYYLAINIFAHENDLERLKSCVHKIVEQDIDAFIVSDPGVMEVIKKAQPNAVFHLSTQANTLNSGALEYWKKQGISRVILARELNQEEIKILANKSDIDLEMFIHGAQCMAYSGRCHLSNYFLKRDANRGQCAQPCRWEYKPQADRLKSHPVEYNSIELEETETGTFILNSTDLCLLERIPEIIKAGILSLKIEGRNKTSYYVANVTRVYRKIIDEFLQNQNLSNETIVWAQQELSNVSHRPYSQGFFGSGEQFSFEQGGYIKNFSLVAIAQQFDEENILLKVRDNLKVGDEVNFIFPDDNRDFIIEIDKIFDFKTRTNLEEAHNGFQVLIKTPHKICKNEIIVRKQIKR